MDYTKTLFCVQLTDGYSFRNIISIVKSETDYATMVFSEKAIEISFINTSNCAIHKIHINTQELSLYWYNIRDNDGNLMSEYPIAFETNEMFNTTKGIGRRDGIRLYWIPGDNQINVQPIKSNTKDLGRASALFVHILNMEYIKYDIIVGYNPDPNVRVQAKDFAFICSQANTLKCSALRIVGCSNAVKFESILPNNSIASIDQFRSQTEVPKSLMAAHNLDEIDNIIGQLRLGELAATAPPTSTGISLNIVKSEDLMTVKVPIATVKALSKIHNISPTGSFLRFYFAEGRPTKLESPIGTYGLYTICLRNGR